MYVPDLCTCVGGSLLDPPSIFLSPFFSYYVHIAKRGAMRTDNYKAFEKPWYFHRRITVGRLQEF